MQDGAPSHRAAGTINDLEERGVTVIVWPPYSPDLNPIKTVWNWMKDYIEEHYGSNVTPTYDQLRLYVKEAWEAVPDWWLQHLLSNMKARCEAVIAAGGGYTKH